MPPHFNTSSPTPEQQPRATLRRDRQLPRATPAASTLLHHVYWTIVSNVQVFDETVRLARDWTLFLLFLPPRMPRQPPSSSPATPAAAAAESTAGLGATAAFLLLCAFTVMACASHSRKCRWSTVAGRWQNSDPVISIHQVQPGADEGHGEICVWQKGILMGEKCQLPDFSGVITYDSAGNLVAPGRPRLMSSVK